MKVEDCMSKDVRDSAFRECQGVKCDWRRGGVNDTGGHEAKKVALF